MQWRSGPAVAEGGREGIRCIAEGSDWSEPEPVADVQGGMLRRGKSAQNDRDGL